MPRPRREWRDDQLYCRGHGDWHHYSRFKRRERQSPQGTQWDYDTDCRLWLQTVRVATKNEDPAREIVVKRVTALVTAANRLPGPKVDSRFFLEDLNYRCLIPMVRAFIAWPEECFCPNCGSTYNIARDLTFDHRLPPRNARDWERLHARNVGPLDRECNSSKNDTDYDAWLEKEEANRLDAAAHNARLRAQNALSYVGPLFDGFAP